MPDQEARSAASGHELLERAAEKVCAYVWTDEKAPSCVDEWPNQPETWCGACLSKEALRLGPRTGRIVHGDA